MLSIVVLLGSAALAGCGPSSGLDVGVKHEGSTVFFGVTPAPTPTIPPQPPNAEIVPNFPGALSAPPPPSEFVPPLAAPAVICPTPSPVAFPKVSASTTATQPPAQSGYEFRYTGTQTFNPDTPSQQVKQLPTSGSHTITNVSKPASDGHYSFDVVEVYNGTTTTTKYLDEPNGSSTGSSETTQAGLYLQAMRTTDSSGTTSSFTPQPPVELMPFPANPGTQFQSAGVDPLTQTAMEEDSPGGQVGSRERVATCGDVVDSWHVEINGRFVTGRGSSTTTFDIVFNVATQYGGLLVAEHAVESGTDQASGQPYRYDVKETINSVPLDAGAPPQ